MFSIREASQISGVSESTLRRQFELFDTKMKEIFDYIVQQTDAAVVELDHDG